MSGGNRKIKGGGRAIMSRESQQALIGLLMRLSDEDDDNNKNNKNNSNNAENGKGKGNKAAVAATTELFSSSSSNNYNNINKNNHDRKREEKKFVRRLVRDYQQQQLKKKFNNSNNKRNNDNNNNSSSRERSSSPAPVLVPVPVPTTTATSSVTTAVATTMSSNNEKVRIEVVEAIFKNDGDNDKKKKKKKHDDNHKGKKKKKDKQEDDDEMKFKEGIKKVMVLSRSTKASTILKLAQSKMMLRTIKKKPIRVFLKISRTMIIDLEQDSNLSGIDDGTVIYVTATPKTTGHNKSKQKDGTTITTTTSDDDNDTDDDDTDDDNNDEVIDPLDLVKRAYQRQELHQRRRQTTTRTTQKQILIDKEKKMKHSAIRSGLPAASYKDTILDSVTNNRVVILCGSTGCGKSTQVPQFLLENQQTKEKEIKTESDNNNIRVHRPYIVVTQPRRVAAISLANRVAEEQGSPPPGKLGSSIGYMVRSDRRVEERTCRIIYLTVGILLRMLVQPQSQSQENTNYDTALSIDSISHLIIDEVHERDVNTDFTLTLLKGLMRTPRLSHLRLILMSATAASDLFVRYFTTSATTTPVVVNIPGRTFPVDVKWLYDCERFSGTTIWLSNSKNNDSNNKNDNDDDIGGSVVLSPRAMQKIDNRLIRSLIAKIVHQQQSEGQLPPQVEKVKSYRTTGAILVFLPGRGEIESLASCLYNNDINNNESSSSNDNIVTGDRSICTILKLHSSVPKCEQERVFKPAIQGTVKIVLATNIAETSVTISDVSHVIDTCRVKESRFNASTRIKELVTVWTSKASTKQRAGRAGRTSAGTCWRLCTESFYQESMVHQTAPEMVRTPLDELILQICLLYEQRRDEFYHTLKKEEKAASVSAAAGNGDNINNGGGRRKRSFATGAQPIKFLSMTPAPPPRNSLLQACRHLLEVDALRVVDIGDCGGGGGGDKGDNNDTNEQQQQNNNCGNNDEATWSYRLTPLGYHLSRLPMDAKVGKVLIVGCILGCLDGALTVAAALSCTKSCFISVSSSGRQQQQINPSFVLQARDSLIENGFGGKNWMGGTVKGDLIAVIATYRAWKKQKSDRQKWKFCNAHALDNMILKDMDQLRNQFTDLIIDAGFVTRPTTKIIASSTVDRGGGGGRNHNTGSLLLQMEECNHAHEDALLTSCCLVAGLYPNICSLSRPRKGGPKGGRLYTSDGVVCRPQSNSFQRKRVQQAAETGKDAYAVFHAKHRSIGTGTVVSPTSSSSGPQRPPDTFLTELNFISRFALLLFGGELEIVKNALIVDGWLKFKVSGGCDENSKKRDDNMDNAVLILSLKERLDKIILEHVLETCAASPEEKSKMSERHRSVMEVVRKLLSDES